MHRLIRDHLEQVLAAPANCRSGIAGFTDMTRIWKNAWSAATKSRHAGAGGYASRTAYGRGTAAGILRPRDGSH